MKTQRKIAKEKGKCSEKQRVEVFSFLKANEGMTLSEGERDGGAIPARRKGRERVRWS